MTNTSDDAGEKEIPAWVTRVVNEKNGEDVKFLFEKQLTASDVGRQQSRLLVQRASLNKTIRSALVNEDEISAVGLDNDVDDAINNNINGEDTAADVTTTTTRVKKTFARGLKLKAYTRNMWKYHLNMILWESSNGLVINGSDWSNLVRLQGFKRGTQVRVWSFRSEEEGTKKVLNLVIGKAEVNGSQ